MAITTVIEIQVVSKSAGVEDYGGNQRRWKDCQRDPNWARCGAGAVDFCHETLQGTRAITRSFLAATNDFQFHPKSDTQQSISFAVPSELLHLVFLNLSPQDLLRCTRVCRTFCTLLSLSNNSFWTAVFVRRYGEAWKPAYLRANNISQRVPTDCPVEYCSGAISCLIEDDQLVADLRGRVPFPLGMRSLFFGYWRFIEGHCYRLIFFRYGNTKYTVYARAHQTWSSLCLQFQRDTGLKIGRLVFAGVVFDMNRKVGSYSTLQKESTVLALPPQP